MNPILLRILSACRGSCRVTVILAIAGMLGVRSLEWCADRWLDEHRPRILASLNEGRPGAVRIERLRFRFFGGVIAEDLRLAAGVHPALSSMLVAERLRMSPSVSLFPVPSLDWHVTFERPSLEVRAGARDILQMGRFVRSAPTRSWKWGPLRLQARLASLRIRDGRVSLLSPVENRSWRQEFDGVDISSGRAWWRGDRLSVRGHIAGNPQASFHLEGRLRSSPGQALDSSVRFDCRKFTTAYLGDHLGRKIDLPGQTLTASIRVKMREGRRFSSRGRIAVPEITEGGRFTHRLLRLVSPTLRYDLAGGYKDGRLRLTKLVLRAPGLTLSGLGEADLADPGGRCEFTLTSPRLPLSRLKALLPEVTVDSGDVRVALGLSGDMRRLVPELEINLLNAELRYRGFSLQKTAGTVRLTANGAGFEEIWAFVNNVPIGVGGRIDWGGRQRGFALDVRTFPGQIPALREHNPFNAKIRLEGTPDGNGAWQIRTEGIRSVPAEGPGRADTWAADLKGFRTNGWQFDDLPQRLIEGMPFAFERGRFHWTGAADGSVRRTVELDRAAGRLAADANTAVRLKLRRAQFSGGQLRLDVRLRPDRAAGLDWSGRGALVRADATRVLEFFGRELPVRGRFSVIGRASGTLRKFEARGRAHLAQGNIGPLRHLERLAEESGVDSLTRPSYDRISGSFAFREGRFQIRDLLVLAPCGTLAGEFEWGPRKRIGGRFSLHLPVTSIRESSKLARLVRFVGENSAVDLDFKIGGTLAWPRIEWLAGAFKHKLEMKLAPWMYGTLTREIEKRFCGSQ